MISLHEVISEYPGAAEICLVASDRPCQGLDLADERGLKTQLVRYKGHTKSHSEATLAHALQSVGADYILLAGFMRILSADFVAKFENRIVNIHPSLLPKYKGLDTHQRAIDAGDDDHGASVHLVTAGLDEGPVLAQVRIPIKPSDTAATLATRLLPQEHLLYADVVRALIEKKDLII